MVRGLKVHQGKMKCFREKGQGPHIDQDLYIDQISTKSVKSVE